VYIRAWFNINNSWFETHLKWFWGVCALEQQKHYYEQLAMLKIRNMILQELMFPS